MGLKLKTTAHQFEEVERDATRGYGCCGDVGLCGCPECVPSQWDLPTREALIHDAKAAHQWKKKAEQLAEALLDETTNWSKAGEEDKALAMEIFKEME